MGNFWRHVRRLTRQAVTGEVFIAAESLFRAEQFFWQTGVEVGRGAEGSSGKYVEFGKGF